MVTTSRCSPAAAPKQAPPPVFFGEGPLRTQGIHNQAPYNLAMLGQVFRRAEEFDIIHCHVDYPTFPFGEYVDTATLHTLHGRLDLPGLRFIFDTFPQIPLVAISDSHRNQLPNLNWQGYIHHGLPKDLYHFSPKPDGYLAFLGRMAEEKRPDLAIEVAKGRYPTQDGRKGRYPRPRLLRARGATPPGPPPDRVPGGD